MPVLEPAAVIARLKATNRDLLALVSGAPPAQLVRSPGPEEWSPAMVVSHLADAELVYSVRIRLMLTSDRPYLTAYEEAVWAKRFSQLDEDAKESMGRWRSLRKANITLFESLDDDEWTLSGLHAERGEVSVLAIAEVLANHDRDHLSQIRQGLAVR
ncbi:MAG: DinB family protein [Acidimicrobiales bacterium]